MAHGWDGIVRLEAAADTAVAAAVVLADRVACTLARFASVPHKDPVPRRTSYPSVVSNETCATVSVTLSSCCDPFASPP